MLTRLLRRCTPRNDAIVSNLEQIQNTMPNRLIEIYIPADSETPLKEILKEHSCIGVWSERIAEGKVHIQVLVPAEESEPILDRLEKRLSNIEGFRIVILPVEALIPRLEVTKTETTKEEELANGKKPPPKSTRISREELYADINDAINLNTGFIALVMLSTIVAAFGLLRDNVAVIIGAMVIAPLLGPNVGLSLATTLGDMSLAKKAFKANITGVLIALVMSVIMGFFLRVNPEIHEIASRTQVSLGDIAVALASGSAGALAFTTGASAMLVGVMVAVALLPPLVALGLLLGSGYYGPAFGAFLLLLTNLICVNLSGVVTFLVQGVRPLTWWEAGRAKKATLRAIVIWISLLAALVVLILLSQRG